MVKKKRKMGETKKDYGKPIIGIVAFTVAIITLFLPIVPIRIAYNEVEPYYRECRYEVVSATFEESWDIGRGTYHISEVTIKNVDSYGGTFTVMHYLYDINGLYDTKRTTEYLAPGGTKTFRAEFDTRWLQDVRAEYSVSAPTVRDERIVTRYRTVYKSIIEIFIYG